MGHLVRMANNITDYKNFGTVYYSEGREKNLKILWRTNILIEYIQQNSFLSQLRPWIDRI